MALPGKTKEPASDMIMAADKLRPLLALARKEPVSAAVGLTADDEAVLLLDKLANPKKTLALLRTSAAKSKLVLNPSSLRFGRARIDADYDAGMVRLFINKDGPGKLRAKLVEVVKRCALSKVEINVDGELEEEPEERAEVPSDGAEPPPPPAAEEAPNAAALANALATLLRRIAVLPPALKPDLVKRAGAANAALKTGNAQATAAEMRGLLEALSAAEASAPQAGASQPGASQPEASQPEASQGTAEPSAAPSAQTLTAELGQLARRIADSTANDPAKRARLASLAGGAQTALKSGDLAAAGAALDSLRTALDAPSSKPDPKVAFAHARLRYDTGRKQVGAEIDKLMAAIRTHFQGDADFANIDSAIEEFAVLRDMLDDRLIDALDRGYTAASAQGVIDARAEAATIVSEYQAFLAGNARMLNGIDSNPFIPVSVEAVLPPLLAELAGQLA